MYHFEKSSNGMAGIYLVFRNVPLMESKETFGVSHLLEHMVTDAVKPLEEAYDTDCIEFNAFTGKEYIVFYITGLQECINRHKELFIKTICEYTPKEEHFQKQIIIVMQEFNDWYGEVECNALANYMSCMRGYISAIGTKDALENLTFATVEQFYRENVKLNDIYEVGAESSNPHMAYSAIIHPAMTKHLYVPKCSEVNVLSLPMVYGFEERDISDKEYLAVIIAKMLSYGLGSPLYKIREEMHLIYGIHISAVEYAGRSTILIATSGKAADKGRIGEAIRNIVSDSVSCMTRERYNIIVTNSINRIRIKKQYNYNWDWVSYAVDSANMRDNIDKVTYDETIAFYEQYYKNNLGVFAGYDDLILKNP